MEFNQGIPISKNEVLKWNTPKEELFKVGTPVIDDSKTFARWSGVKLFNDQVVNVTVNFEYENPNNKLEYVRIECPAIEDKVQAGAPRKIYEDFTAILKDLYGNPTHEKTVMNYPQRIWEFANYEIILGIAERFMEYSIFVIRIKTHNSTLPKAGVKWWQKLFRN
jgi:hypothetical protein